MNRHTVRETGNRVILFSLHRPELDAFPKVGLPIYPRSTGYFRRCAGSTESVPPGEKPFVQFYWCTRGEGEMIRAPGEEPDRIREGAFFYRLPMEQHEFRAISPEWEYRWIAFDGPFAESFMRSYNYPAAPFHAGECPHELFLEFGSRMQEQTPFCWRQMVSLICDILAAAGGMNAEGTLENRRLQEAIRICRENFHNPNLNVNSLAERLEIDRTTLRRLFLRKISITPSEYLGQLRLQKAISLLKQTAHPLTRIAELSGFHDVNYFCRSIRRSTGRTPGEIRRIG